MVQETLSITLTAATELLKVTSPKTKDRSTLRTSIVFHGGTGSGSGLGHKRLRVIVFKDKLYKVLLLVGVPD